MKKFPTTVWVVAVALVDAEDRVLMQLRRQDREHGGLWEFPGGKVEADETPGQSLCREIAEELDLVIEPGELVPVSFATRPDLPHVILLYTCRTWRGEPSCLDGEEIAWFKREDILSLDMPPLDVPLAQALLNQLKR
mgnify:CR=1 FL=1